MITARKLAIERFSIDKYCVNMIMRQRRRLPRCAEWRHKYSFNGEAGWRINGRTRRFTDGLAIAVRDKTRRNQWPLIVGQLFSPSAGVYQ